MSNRAFCRGKLVHEEAKDALLLLGAVDEDADVRAGTSERERLVHSALQVNTSIVDNVDGVGSSGRQHENKAHQTILGSQKRSITGHIGSSLEVENNLSNDGLKRKSEHGKKQKTKSLLEKSTHASVVEPTSCKKGENYSRHQGVNGIGALDASVHPEACPSGNKGSSQRKDDSGPEEKQVPGGMEVGGSRSSGDLKDNRNHKKQKEKKRGRELAMTEDVASGLVQEEKGGEDAALTHKKRSVSGGRQNGLKSRDSAQGA
ncbi:hypothetical protein CEUSTIGMA_g5903.t1 [Chlamydomonas eustigma]|uniref:Uncharacterized protein n=1 Tax=Chlamydomonas eustigma TaxID=1157962 RepID=A0A250X5U6_9CHLO|nr:hypothetical protein CEUSTIGMA_g5903.t1 [Chlamydomonas eustigma]|eukprot:GAX78464.1 hypothetical protein CEUSTIGMA_g5903.t1 [Chlamydomonas eustigma]